MSDRETSGEASPLAADTVTIQRIVALLFHTVTRQCVRHQSVRVAVTQAMFVLKERDEFHVLSRVRGADDLLPV